MDSAFNLSPAYLFVFSKDNYILQMNQMLLSHLGYQEGEVVGKKKIDEILTVGSRIFLQTHFLPLIKMKGNIDEIFLSFSTKSGTDLPVLLNVKTVERGDVVEVHCGGMQISQRNRYEKELLQAKNNAELALLENKELAVARATLEENKMQLEQQLQMITILHNQQSEINKVLSHDLQEPLRKIRMFSGKLSAQYGNDESDGAESIRKISKYIDSVRLMLDNLQKYHLLESRKIKHVPIDLKSILHDIEKTVNSDTVNVKLTFKSDRLPEFEADKKLIVRMFSELMSNAVKFKKSDQDAASVAIDAVEINENVFVKTGNTYRYEKFVKITFADEGSGIYSKDDKVFQLFKRDNHLQSSGMGLAYCRKIVEIHNGRITVSSKFEHGTVFTILLPLTKGQ